MRINYAAVAVSAIAYWMLGALWYGLLFGPRWMALENISVAQGQNMNSMAPYAITFFLDILMAIVLAQFCKWRSAHTAGSGATIGLLLWVGIVAPITLTTHIYEMRPMALFAINEGYSLAGLCLMGLILGTWTKSNKVGFSS